MSWIVSLVKKMLAYNGQTQNGYVRMEYVLGDKLFHCYVKPGSITSRKNGILIFDGRFLRNGNDQKIQADEMQGCLKNWDACCGNNPARRNALMDLNSCHVINR